MTLTHVLSNELQHEILSCLTAGQLLVVGARWLGGMTHREIADVLEVSPMTISNWLAAAQTNILEQMPELEHEAAQREIKTRMKEAEPDPWRWLRVRGEDGE